MSAQLSDDKERAMEASERQLVRALAPSAFFTVISGGMLFSARQAIALKQFKNAGEFTVFMSKLASLGALFEFIMNPIFGKLADAYGRRRIIPIGNIMCLLVRMLLFKFPDKLWPLVIEQAVSVPCVTSYFTTYRAALGDRLEGKSFANANASIGMAIGASLIAGPLVTKTVMSRMDPKYCYAISCCFVTASLTHLAFNFEETLPPEKRKPLVLSDMQPFSFMQIMKDSVLRRLMLITGMQSFTEGRNVTDILSIYMLEDLKWNWDQINNFVATYGFALILSGMTVKPMLAALGMRSFTTFSNVCNIMSLLCYARCPPLSSMLPNNAIMYLSVFFGAPGGRKRDAAESLIMKIGSERGFGNGFISGSMMNFRAVINILGPVLFGSLYAWGAKRGRSAIVWYVGALTILAAEFSLRSLSNRELGLDRNGQIPKNEQRR